MKRTIKNSLTVTLSMLTMVAFIVSCNKDVEAPVPNTFPVSSNASIGEAITADANFSILRQAVNKVGLLNAVTNKNSVFTVFAPDNAAFIASGIPSTAAIDALPTATVASIINYHIIPGRQINSTGITTNFPSVQMPTNFIFPSPNTSPLVRFSIFPSRRGSAAWANNIPVTQADIAVANGVVHKVARVILPPSRVLLDTLARDPEFSFLIAAVVRADSDLPPTSTSRFQYALGEPLASLTVFAPTNTAFKGLINALTGGAVPLNAPDASFLGVINTLPLTTLKGIIAYHVLGQRAFSVNFTTTGASYPTLLNGSVPTHPGVTVTSTLVSGFGAALTVKGVINATASNAIATATGVDRHAINGVFYKIDQVLLPQ